MESKAGKNKADDNNPADVHKEIRSVYEGQQFNKNAPFDKREKDLNLKIMEITMTIKDKYPELSKYLEELPVTIPTVKDLEITLKNLNAYCDSLNAILNKYKLEHP